MASMIQTGDDKAGYNTSSKITETLGILLNSYISNMKVQQYNSVLTDINALHDIVSAKIKDNESDEIDDRLYQIEKDLPLATMTYNVGGKSYYKHPDAIVSIKKRIHSLFRYVWKLLDKYGYGMISQEDPRLAVLQR